MNIRFGIESTQEHEYADQSAGHDLLKMLIAVILAGAVGYSRLSLLDFANEQYAMASFLEFFFCVFVLMAILNGGSAFLKWCRDICS